MDLKYLFIKKSRDKDKNDLNAGSLYLLEDWLFRLLNELYPDCKV